MAERLRGRAGQAQRLRRLKRTNGLCEMCKGAGRTRAATVVDHIKPLAHGGSDDDGNTRNLCDEHHREVTAEQFDHEVARGKRGVDADGKPLDRDHPWSGRRTADQMPPRRPTPPGVKSG